MKEFYVEEDTQGIKIHVIMEQGIARLLGKFYGSNRCLQIILNIIEAALYALSVIHSLHPLLLICSCLYRIPHKLKISFPVLLNYKPLS